MNEPIILPLAITERNAILAALELTGGNRKACAQALQISYRSLRYKLKQYESDGCDMPLTQAQRRWAAINKSFKV